MEKRSGYRECPRCGLRNKPSVTQCDFCGWQFEESQDDWIDQIRALEKISTDRSTMAVDENLSKRIEATIKKPDDVFVDDFIVERDPTTTMASESIPEPQPFSAPPTPEARGETFDTQPKEPESPKLEPAVETTSEPEPQVLRAEVEIEKVIEPVELVTLETTIETAEAIREPEPVPVSVEPLPQEPPIMLKEEAQLETIAETTVFDMRTVVVPVAILASGVAAYVGILLFSVFQPVNWALGWTISIVGAIMVTYGCGQVYEIWKNPNAHNKRIAGRQLKPEVAGEKGKEVFICPLCNEVVSENDDHCSSCGAEFEIEKS